MPPTNPPDPHDDLEEIRGPASDPILSGSLKAQPGFTRKLALALVALLVLFAMVGGPLAIAYLSHRDRADRRTLMFPLISKPPPMPGLPRNERR